MAELSAGLLIRPHHCFSLWRLCGSISDLSFVEKVSFSFMESELCRENNRNKQTEELSDEKLFQAAG